MRITKGERIFYIINSAVLLVLGLICIYPLVYVASSSVSSVQAIAGGKVTLLPIEPTLNAYKAVLKESDIWLGYANAIYYTIVGTIFSLALTILGAYPLSKKGLKGKGSGMFLVVFSMWFDAGTVPRYLNFVDLGLLNNRLGVILSGAYAGTYIVIMRSFFQSITDSLEEAALIDGAGHFRIMFQIYLPLSKAAIATVGLMFAIARWNSYFWPMLLLSRATKLQPLQVVLKRVLLEVTTSLSAGGETVTNYSTKSMTYAIIMVSVIPMIMVYPFIQKYFAKGVMIGSVKG